MGPAKRLFRVLEDPEGRKRDPSIGASSAVTFLRVPGRWGWAGLAGPSEKIRSEAVGSPVREALGHSLGKHASLR